MSLAGLPPAPPLLLLPPPPPVLLPVMPPPALPPLLLSVSSRLSGRPSHGESGSKMHESERLGQLASPVHMGTAGLSNDLPLDAAYMSGLTCAATSAARGVRSRTA